MVSLGGRSGLIQTYGCPQNLSPTGSLEAAPCQPSLCPLIPKTGGSWQPHHNHVTLNRLLDFSEAAFPYL